MRAIVCDDFEECRVAEVPTPEPAADELLLAVKRVQLSITECQLYHGAEVVHYESVRDRMAAGDGLLFGHEFCAEVAEVGADVDGFTVGDRVYAAGKLPCHACTYCEAGYTQFCKAKATIGLQTPGACAEYLTLPPGPLRRVPDGVSDAEGAALQPMASAVLCVRDAEIADGDVVVVTGAGVMGYQCGQLALQQGASDVVAVDVNAEKAELAESRGMIGVDASTDDPVAVVDDLTDGIGADVVLECVGGDQSHANEGTDPLAQAVQMLRSGGRIVQVGSIAGELTVSPRQMRSKQLQWINPLRGVVSLGPNADSGDLAAKLVADGRVDIADCITHEVRGLDAFEEAVDITTNKADYGAFGPAQVVVSE
ncbi:alcohol dehydrogenase catalytic domain-containing protein [Salinirubellus salinus]|uniref:Alcohol dehydrogenase catalytic domain-containing protein n=1 Tax=Salinirubellus salinus TaxID=1364945 RepID=A0A9E7U4K8_9EURY|nr:alcohol dehydrogenase catalytic domain-containing protein [Salinirubellus salinus]UWM54435.1 alcohol dehydrogenase catalytic domain-containing protein [Salinirubellus salinus]